TSSIAPGRGGCSPTTAPATPARATHRSTWRCGTRPAPRSWPTRPKSCSSPSAADPATSTGQTGAMADTEHDPVFYASAGELVGELQRGKLSSRELLDAYLARVEERDGELNAVVALDVDRARRDAAAADDAASRGESLGPLHGLPMTVKDAFETEGL